jgi:hypothetical protein
MIRLSARLRYTVMLILMLAAPARADDVVYPPGSRIGLAIPPSLHASASFPGFEDRDNSVALLLTALPPEAYAAFEKSDTLEGLKKLGATLDKQETLSLPSGNAALIITHQDKLHTWMLVAPTPTLTAMVTMRVPDAAKDIYSDQVIRGLLASFAVRAEVPVEEQLALLPFKVGEMANFTVGGVLPGRGIMLTDAAAPGTDAKALQPHISVMVMPGNTPEAGDRDDIARQIFRSIPGLAEVRITGSEQIRIGGQQGHEIMASGKDPDGADISLVQWLRFGGGAYLHFVGVAPTAAWPQAYARFRAVRDGIESR